MYNIKLILILLNINRLGKKTINKILEKGVPENTDSQKILDFLNKNKLEIKRIPNVNIEDIELAKKKCNDIIKKCDRYNIKMITILDNDFPQKLRNIEDNPLLLYYKGNLECIKENKALAIVGTREPTLHGQKIAYRLGHIISENKFVVISGLAIGCDKFAHLGCIENNGKTVAVMPCGLDVVYPKENTELFERILENDGCIISEYSPGKKIFKNQFVERDRLQSALSLGVLVVETKVNSGTFHTINYAFNQKKIVGCYRHNTKYINQESVKGNLKLLKDSRVMEIYDENSLKKYIKKLEEFNTNVKYKKKEIYIQGKFEL